MHRTQADLSWVLSLNDERDRYYPRTAGLNLDSSRDRRLNLSDESVVGRPRFDISLDIPRNSRVYETMTVFELDRPLSTYTGTSNDSYRRIWEDSSREFNNIALPTVPSAYRSTDTRYRYNSVSTPLESQAQELYIRDSLNNGSIDLFLVNITILHLNIVI